MKESMKSNPAEGVGVAVVLEKNDQGEEQHYVYLVNERKDALKGCLVVSRGYGRHMETEQLIENYLFAEREPLREEVIGLIEGVKPTILQRKTVGDRILNRIMLFVETFVNGFNKVA
jgi:type I restriction enzyme R subunit